MVPLQHRTKVLMAGVAGWGPEGGAWISAHMARAYHEALGVSFQSYDPRSTSTRCCTDSPRLGNKGHIIPLGTGGGSGELRHM